MDAGRDRSARLAALLRLSHRLGAENRRLAILGEGNVSAKLSDDTFLVKASGSSLGSLTEAEVVECCFEPLLKLIGNGSISDQEIEAILYASRVSTESKKPSVEALFHAYLLTLPNVEFVGHTHPISVNQLLCSPRGRDFARRRLFPDEIVCCGPESVYIEYTDPGLCLAQSIRSGCTDYMRRHDGRAPRTILLENHGLIAVGTGENAVIATTLMADKAAEIFGGAAAVGGPLFLSAGDVARIDNRMDEHYRQRALKL